MNVHVLFYLLTICKLETPKQVLRQTVKTQMKCQICSISSGSKLFAKTKTIFRERNLVLVGN